MGLRELNVLLLHQRPWCLQLQLHYFDWPMFKLNANVKKLCFECKPFTSMNKAVKHPGCHFTKLSCQHMLPFHSDTVVTIQWGRYAFSMSFAMIPALVHSATVTSYPTCRPTIKHESMKVIVLNFDAWRYEFPSLQISEKFPNFIPVLHVLPLKVMAFVFIEVCA